RGRPEQMGLRDLIAAFIEFREEVIVRRTKFELAKARDRGHVLAGLTIAVANIDEVIRIIRTSRDPAEARERLAGRAWPVGDMMALIELIADPRTVVVDGREVTLTDEQARAILALTLSRLTGLGRDEIHDEAKGLADTIRGHLELLGSREMLLDLMRSELREVRERFAVPRRTAIVDGGFEMEDEDLIPREEMVVTVTHSGYVKRTPLSAYRTQHHGGKGRSGMATKEEDAVVGVFSASTHAPVLFFASNGKAYKMKVWRLPLGGPTSKGKAFVNLLPLEPGETIMNVLPLPEDESTWENLDIMFATRSGDVRRNKLSDFSNVNRAGKIAMKLEDGDHMVGVALCDSSQDVLLTTALARCVRFAVDDVRVFRSRESTGVRGVRLGEGDEVISIAILRRVEATPAEREAYLKQAAELRRATGESDEETAGAADEPDEDEAEEEEGASGETAALSVKRFAELGAAEQLILTVTETGLGKRSSAYDYRRSKRGGRGLIAHDLSRKGGKLVASFPVENGDEILLMTDGGQLIRVPVGNIRIASRNTQGVIIFRTAEDDCVVSVERLAEPEGEGALEEGGE
ncbi:MAG: DNA gyrase C-terminal beta-propeller domain-containing protein, partial [Caulobacteraceae bacterium]